MTYGRDSLISEALDWDSDFHHDMPYALRALRFDKDAGQLKAYVIVCPGSPYQEFIAYARQQLLREVQTQGIDPRLVEPVPHEVHQGDPSAFIDVNPASEYRGIKVLGINYCYCFKVHGAGAFARFNDSL